MRKLKSFGSKTKEASVSKLANGYILEPVLIVFSFVLLFSIWSTLCVQSRLALLQASKRSKLDLAVLEVAKIKAGEISWQRRCNLEEQDLDTTQMIQNHQVSFRDYGTYLKASYQEKKRTFSILLYYDESGLVKVEYQAK